MVGLGNFHPPLKCKCPSYTNGRKTFNPYYVCSHKCLGCPIRYGRRWKYFGRSADTPIGVNVEKAIKDYYKIRPFSEIEISTQCDPFDLRFERDYRITRTFLFGIQKRIRKDVYLTFLTKSALISEYISLIPKDNSVIQFSIESYDKKTKITSPMASSYDERLETIECFVEEGYKVGVRIDPLIPNFDTKDEVREIIRDCDCRGVKHITISFIKLFHRQLENVSKRLGYNLEPMMIEKSNGELFVKDKVRLPLAKEIKKECKTLGLGFAMCRENLIKDTALCDCFDLLKDYKPVTERKKFKQLTLF